MHDLSGHSALVTGATQGVGRAIALCLARAGANVAVHGLHEDDEARQVADDCRAHGVQAVLLAADLAREPAAAAADLGRAALAALPDIDILVGNVGTYIDKPFLEMDEATFVRTMHLNVFAGYFLTQFFARTWVERKVPGRVVLTGSINGRLSESAHSAYDASKGAVEAMVRSLCVELAPQGIRVNGMAPGLVYTPLTAPALDNPAFRRWMELHTPSGEVPGPEVCGDAVVFLVSDGAHHIHGQMLLVDGGMSIWQQPDPPAQWQ